MNINVINDINDELLFSYDPRHIPTKYDQIVFKGTEYMVHSVQHQIKEFGVGVNSLNSIDIRVVVLL